MDSVPMMAAAGGGFIVLIAMVIAGKPLRRLLVSGTQGLCLLAAVNLTSGLTGVSLGLGLFSGTCCVAFGIPGVILLLFLRVLFPI